MMEFFLSGSLPLIEFVICDVMSDMANKLLSLSPGGRVTALYSGLIDVSGRQFCPPVEVGKKTSTEETTYCAECACASSHHCLLT